MIAQENEKTEKLEKKRTLCVLLTVLMLTGIIGYSFSRVMAAPGDTVDFGLCPVPKIDQSNVGYRIARAMHRLETSTAENPNTVKIAVTGQSISDGGNVWTQNLVNWLKEKYPHAKIEYRNFAIGGFASQCLYKRVPNDMASFYPDLVICYVYGDHTKMDRLIKDIRETTTAEIMLQTCHYTEFNDQMSFWDNLYSYQLMVDIANKYHVELCQIRPYWRKFIRDNRIQPSNLLTDGVHLNASGQTLMLELMKQYFVYRPSNAQSIIDGHTIPISASDWKNGVLEKTFSGNRVEVVPGTGTQYAADVLIDGKKPSETKDTFIRSDESKGMWDTNIGIVHYNRPPGEQKWTIEITSGTNKNDFEYNVTGSVTGDEGKSENRILDGTHLKLNEESFVLNFKSDADVVPGDGRPNFKVEFLSILNGTDVYNGSKSLLASGLEVREHTLKLSAHNASQIPDIKAIKIFNPKELASFDIIPPPYEHVNPSELDGDDNPSANFYIKR